MSCKISEEILFNRQVNYLIIEKLWEHHNKGKGKDEFYEMMGIDKNAYTRIRTADTYNCVDLEKRWERKYSHLRKLGLSKEIMIGLERIETNGISMKDWNEYLDYRYVNTESNSTRISVMQTFNRNLKKLFDGLVADKKATSDIGKLFYFIVYGRAVTLDMPDAEMVDLRDSLNRVTIENMQVCDKELRKEIYESLKEKYRQLDIMIKYENLIK